MTAFDPLVSTPYLGEALTQLDGTLYQYSNCVAAGSSELANCSSLGFWQVSPSRLRNLTGDTSGGLDYGEASDAVKRATNGEVVLAPVYWVPNSTLDDVLDAKKVTGISIRCSATINTAYRTSPTYTGTHFLVVGAKRYATVTRADGTKYQQKQALVMDPGHSSYYLKWQWWPFSLLIAAANASAGADKLHLMYTRDLTNVSRKVLHSGKVYSTPNLTSTVTGTITAGLNKTVVTTERGGSYSANGHTCLGWSQLAANQFVPNTEIR